MDGGSVPDCEFEFQDTPEVLSITINDLYRGDKFTFSMNSESDTAEIIPDDHNTGWRAIQVREKGGSNPAVINLAVSSSAGARDTVVVSIARLVDNKFSHCQVHRH